MSFSEARPIHTSVPDNSCMNSRARWVTVNPCGCFYGDVKAEVQTTVASLQSQEKGSGDKALGLCGVYYSYCSVGIAISSKVAITPFLFQYLVVEKL